MTHLQLITRLAAYITAIAAGTATAQTILVDFGPDGTSNPAPTASPDTNGNTWNNFIPGSAYDLFETGGIDTGINLFARSGVAANNPGGLTAPSAALLGDLAIATATQDYIFTSGTTIELVLDGLDPAKTYDLDLFATRATSGTRVTNYDVIGGDGLVTQQLQTSGTDIGSDGMYDGNDDTLASFTGIRADTNGEILINVDVASGGFAYLGAARITVVPTPATCSLVALGGLAALRRRR